MADSGESMEVILARLDERLKAVQERLDEALVILARQNSRLASLERWRAYLTGAIAILAVVLTVALSVAAKL